ncbi:hypothetical protein [Bartonella apis]|uniref:hypothetical protein n=1 Tax=Bartonella apis TaxID=1686310 RepID=UPI002431C84D|nr:hypothetical protein [Bartonella apis]
MITFTISQINDALDMIKDHIADQMRKRTTIALSYESNGRQYTLADLRKSGWDDFDLVRLVWADPRTPFEARKAFQDGKKRLDRLKEYSPLFAPLDGTNSKFGRLVEFFEHQLDAYNAKGNSEAAE